MDTSDEDEEEEEESLDVASTRGGDVDSVGTDNLGDETETLGDREGLVEETLELRVVGWGAVPLNL